MSNVADLGIFDNLQIPILVLDQEKEFLYYNHHSVTFFKTPPRLFKQITSFNDIFLSPSVDFDRLLEIVDEKDSAVTSEEIQINLVRDKEVSYMVVAKLIPYTLGKARYYIISFLDLSVEKSLYDKYKDQLNELKETHQQIVQADKLTVLGELTGGVSHEISNPLTIAAGNVEVLQSFMEDEDWADKKDFFQDCLTNTKESLERINSIIINMKSFLHNSEDKRSYHEFSEILDATEKLVQHSFDKSQVDLKFIVKDDHILGFFNKTKIEQVVVNLLKNALYAAKESNPPGKGTVILTLEKVEEGKYISLSVCDNGNGIDEETKDKMFNTFFTTKDEGEGTGLGLSISKKIIDAHSGRIECEDIKGGGTCFQVFLPSIEVSSYTFNEKYLSGISTSEGKKILVLDNEVQILNLLNTILEEDDYTFIGSNNGRDAVKVLGDVDLDLIITDYEMPGMNGSEFAKLVREKGITCPILYLTSVDHMDVFNEDKDKYKVKGLILKPFQREEVLKTVKKVLEDGN